MLFTEFKDWERKVEYFIKISSSIELSKYSQSKIVLEQQFHSGLHYRNYKGTESIVVIGISPEYKVKIVGCR